MFAMEMHFFLMKNLEHVLPSNDYIHCKSVSILYSFDLINYTDYKFFFIINQTGNGFYFGFTVRPCHRTALNSYRYLHFTDNVTKLICLC